MHLIYAAVRFFPWWALPAAFVLGELGIYLRRKRSRTQRFCWAAVSVLVALSVCWFFFRGDLHSDNWVRTVVQGG
jgi:hypothetical protein